METFTVPRAFVENTRYDEDRREALAELDLDLIDPPIADIVAGFADLPHCFTLQCCCGHFVCGSGRDPHTLKPIPDDYTGPVRYRIAYIGFCIENSGRGRALWRALERIPAAAPGYIQFGSADWFWNDWPNSYALQVEPEAHQFKDEAILDAAEAIRVQSARDVFFSELRAVLAAERSSARGER